MKLNKYILTAGLFAVAFVSCTDLDISPNSQYTEDPSKNSGVDPMIVVEAKMADVYFHLAGTFGLFIKSIFPQQHVNSMMAGIFIHWIPWTIPSIREQRHVLNRS